MSTYKTMAYVKSTSPNLHWNLYVYKPDGYPGYAIAHEGELTHGRSMMLFSFVPLTSRKHIVHMDGRNTAKNRAAVITELFAALQEKKWVDSDETCPEFM